MGYPFCVCYLLRARGFPQLWNLDADWPAVFRGAVASGRHTDGLFMLLHPPKMHADLRRMFIITSNLGLANIFFDVWGKLLLIIHIYIYMTVSVIPPNYHVIRR